MPYASLSPVGITCPFSVSIRTEDASSQLPRTTPAGLSPRVHGVNDVYGGNLDLETSFSDFLELLRREHAVEDGRRLQANVERLEFIGC
jgi:hypothetical protein